MSGISAKEIDSKKPKYLVIFREAAEKNTNTLSSVLKRGKSPDGVESGGVRQEPVRKFLSDVRVSLDTGRKTAEDLRSKQG